MSVLSVYLCSTWERDIDLQRCIGKYQIILAFGVYFLLSVVIPQRFYQKHGERSDQ